jgi:hypothetical protein
MNCLYCPNVDQFNVRIWLDLIYVTSLVGVRNHPRVNKELYRLLIGECLLRYFESFSEMGLTHPESETFSSLLEPTTTAPQSSHHHSLLANYAENRSL